MVWRRLAALLIPGLLFAGCIGVDPDEYPILVGMGLGGWEVTNHFEKDSDNNTEENLGELNLRFMAESTINATIVEYWFEPGDGSEIKHLLASEGDTISHTYSGYGAFMSKWGVIDSEGNEDVFPYSIHDSPALIRHAAYYMNESSVDEPADIFIDPPNPNSVGSPEYFHIESRIANIWGWPLLSEPVDITWELINPNGEVVETHTETIQGGDDYTWELYHYGPERGSWSLVVESSGDVSLNQDTTFRVRYDGFMYEP